MVVFLLGGVIVWGQQHLYTPKARPMRPICLRVERGVVDARGLRPTGRAGRDHQLRSIFRMGADYAGKSGDLKAGSWLIPERATMGEITRHHHARRRQHLRHRNRVPHRREQQRGRRCASWIRETNRYVEKARVRPRRRGGARDIRPRCARRADTRYRVAIAEGTTSWQIVEALKAIDILDGEIAELPAEGTLAPDSYEVRKGDTRAGVIERMQEAQEIFVAAAWASRAEDLPLEDAQEMLVLASIIEKETGVPDERRQVAAVFENRLKRGMRLQTDPTVIYGVTEGKGVLGRGLRASELREATPWNTYVIEGLPPTPIANPGRPASRRRSIRRRPIMSSSLPTDRAGMSSPRRWKSTTPMSHNGAGSRPSKPRIPPRRMIAAAGRPSGATAGDATPCPARRKGA